LSFGIVGLRFQDNQQASSATPFFDETGFNTTKTFTPQKLSLILHHIMGYIASTFGKR
jgi:hypothetical protein